MEQTEEGAVGGVCLLRRRWVVAAGASEVQALDLAVVSAVGAGVLGGGRLGRASESVGGGLLGGASERASGFGGDVASVVVGAGAEADARASLGGLTKASRLLASFLVGPGGNIVRLTVAHAKTARK